MLWKRIALTTLVWSKTQCPCDIATQPQIHGNVKQQKWQRRRQRDIDVLVGLSLICLTYSLGGATIKCHSLSCNGGGFLVQCLVLLRECCQDYVSVWEASLRRSLLRFTAIATLYLPLHLTQDNKQTRTYPS